MEDQDLMRKEVKLLKATDCINSYKELAELLEMSNKGFYNWLNNTFDLGLNKKIRLRELIDTLSMPQ